MLKSHYVIFPLLAVLVGCNGQMVSPEDGGNPPDAASDHTVVPDGTRPDTFPPPPDTLLPPPDGNSHNCVTSDGRILQPGQSYSDGCTSCLCQPSGALSCTAGGDCDVIPPPSDGGGYCYLPNGTVIG